MEAIASAAATEKAHQQLLSAIGTALRSESGSLALLLVEVANLSDLHARLGFEASAQVMRNLKEHFSTALSGRGAVIQFRDGSFCAWVTGIRNAGHACWRQRSSAARSMKS